MRITEYSTEYQDDVKSLLEELQSYIAGLDREGYNILSVNFKEKYFEKTMEELRTNCGKLFLAEENGRVLGMIAGIICEAEDTYSFRAPRRGRITELTVCEEYRGKGIGKVLLHEMENYFYEQNCKGITLDVFAYNARARRFYVQNGFFERTVEMMKKIN